MSNVFRLYQLQFLEMLDLTKTPLNVSPHIDHIDADSVENPISKPFGEIVLGNLELATIMETMEN